MYEDITFPEKLTQAVHGAMLGRAYAEEQMAAEAFALTDEDQEWRLQMIDQPSVMAPRLRSDGGTTFTIEAPMRAFACDIEDLVFPEDATQEPPPDPSLFTGPVRRARHR